MNHEIHTEIVRRLPLRLRLLLSLPGNRRKCHRALELAVEHFPTSMPTMSNHFYTSGVASLEGVFADGELESSREILTQHVQRDYQRAFGSVWVSLIMAIVIELIKYWLESRTHRQMIRTAQLQQKKGF